MPRKSKKDLEFEVECLKHELLIKEEYLLAARAIAVEEKMFHYRQAVMLNILHSPLLTRVREMVNQPNHQTKE